ncbi:MAG TPA: lysophospholipid acyltransferase family protein [Candidatus Krumholzibacteria bacterium]|nr:lysophospholipid acyltransferase family protein [Candidatus Krumholzibacteria bacterium]
MRTRKKLKRAGEIAVVGALIGVARAVPRRLGSAAFAGIGALAARAFERDRLRAVENIAVAFPDAPAPIRAALARASFKALGRNVYEALRLSGMSPQSVRERVERVEGMEHFLDAHRAGKGVIVITGHIGCWELLPAYFVSLGYPVSVVARRMKSERLNAKLVAMRASVGVKSLDRDENPRRMIEPLRRGEILGVLIDQHTRVAGMYVPFFGRPAYTPTAVAKLALATGAAIVPMGIYLGRGGRHVVRVAPAIPIDATLRDSPNKDAAVRAITAECSLAVEQLIRFDPAQWVWFHHRWREEERDEGAQVAYAAQR